MGGHREGKGPVVAVLALTWILLLFTGSCLFHYHYTLALSLNILETPVGFSIAMARVPQVPLTQAQHGLIDLAGCLLTQKPRVVALDGEQSHDP